MHTHSFRSAITGRRVLALIAALAVLVAACSGGGGDEDSLTLGESGMEPPSEADDLAAADLGEGESALGETEESGGSGAPPLDIDLTATTQGRDIISTATVSIEVEDLDAAARQAVAAVERAGGLVFSEDTALRSGARTTLTLKVPPASFRPLLADLAELGELQEQRVDTDDVTATVVDLESRINTAEASVVRLRELIDRADRIEDIARLETELLNRETTLETLRGQLRTIEDQVALSTVTVSLDAVDAGPAADDEDDADSLPTFLDGARAGLDALLVVASGLAAALGAIAPWIPVALALWVGYRLWRRRSTPHPAA